MQRKPSSRRERVGPAPFVSIVIPCRESGARIGSCLDSVLAADYPPDRMEVLVVDGMSRDGTRETVLARAARDPRVRLLDNRAGATPNALNIGIRACRGDIVMRMDAHSVYPMAYVRTLVDWLERSGADNVGTVWVTRPWSDSPRARAIAIAMSHPFGVGNSYFRIGSSEPRFVDTVPFGCFRRELFDRIGFFDEELARDQDDEFNLRIARAGGKVLLLPGPRPDYHARESFAQLWRQYYGYGYYKPLVASKLRLLPSPRHLVPAAFVLSLLCCAALAPCSASAARLLALILAAYSGAAGLVSLAAARGQGGLCALNLPAAFLTLHLAYGAGYLRGLWDFVLPGRRAGSPPRARPQATVQRPSST